MVAQYVSHDRAGASVPASELPLLLPPLLLPLLLPPPLPPLLLPLLLPLVASLPLSGPLTGVPPLLELEHPTARPADNDPSATMAPRMEVVFMRLVVRPKRGGTVSKGVSLEERPRDPKAWPGRFPVEGFERRQAAFRN